MRAATRGTISRRPERSTPLRTCVGCGRQAPKDELIRFVARDGALVPSDSDPGRGAYTCRRLACFERAASRSGFNRTLRRTVRVDRDLAHLYTAP
jgi:predicted RNA-binding protein YlxR (DUF448 family)